MSFNKLRTLIAIHIVVLLSACQSNPFQKDTHWVGQYECLQGVTALDVSIVENKDNQLKAIFNFDHAPTSAKGSFHLTGLYNPETRAVTFTPGDWIERPHNYMTVGLVGNLIDDPTRIEGKVATDGCSNFRLVLQIH